MSKPDYRKDFIHRNINTCVKIMAFIRRYQSLYYFCPTLREIGSSVGITSTSHIFWYIDHLTIDGYVGRKSNASRSTHLTDKGAKFLDEWKIKGAHSNTMIIDEAVRISTKPFDESDVETRWE